MITNLRNINEIAECQEEDIHLEFRILYLVLFCERYHTLYIEIQFFQNNFLSYWGLVWIPFAASE